MLNLNPPNEWEGPQPASFRSLVPEGTRFFHFKAGKGTVTCAIHTDSEDVSYGLALCSPRDHFCRQEGRELASERLLAVYAGEVVEAYNGFGGIVKDPYAGCSNLQWLGSFSRMLVERHRPPGEGVPSWFSKAREVSFRRRRDN